MPKLYIEFRKQKDMGIVWSYLYCQLRFRTKLDNRYTIEVITSMLENINIDLSVRTIPDGDENITAFSDDFHVIRIDTSNEELTRIYNLTTTLKRLKIKHCDTQLLHSVFTSIEDNASRIETVTALHNAQFALVVVRECLDKTHSLKKYLYSINSLSTTPFSLFTTLFYKVIELQDNRTYPMPMTVRSAGIRDFLFFDGTASSDAKGSDTTQAARAAQTTQVAATTALHPSTFHPLLF